MKRNDKGSTVEEVCKNILKKITPSKKVREDTINFSRDLAKKLADKLKRAGIEADVRIQGSIAKDTWLVGDKDIDVFIFLPKKSKRNAFVKVLEVVKSFIGEKWVEAYSEHPYIEGRIEGYKIDFVPCFKINRAEEAISAVDRTPLHTVYIKKQVDQEAKDEIRLFKQFMQGVGAYGAEIKVQGFSGYLCELLVLHYQTFIKTLQEIASWRLGEFIDIENLYSERVNKADLMFNAPLIVVDPVDAKRNVAAAVSKDRMGELIMAARLFLAKPENSFFFPAETEPLQFEAISEKLKRIGFDLIFIVFNGMERAPDVLWGELYKTGRAIKRLLTQNDFKVLREAIWSNETGMNIIVFALETQKLPLLRRHLGPPVDSEEASKFIAKYNGSGMRVLGPWIEDGKWIVGIRRSYVDAATLLRKKLKEKTSEVGIATRLSNDIKEAEVYVNREIFDLYSSNRDFARFLTEFFRGRPRWLK